MSLRRASMLVQVLATVACGEIVGIRDVPTPIEESSDGAPKDVSAAEASADTSEAVPDAMHEESGSDASPGDVASPPADVAADTSIPEGGPEASADATPDAATCAPSWNGANLACNSCGIAHCCGALAACQARDDAGQGTSRCSAFVSCVTGYTGTNPPGIGDTNCKNDGMYSPSEYAFGESTLSCVRTMCPTDCIGL